MKNYTSSRRKFIKSSAFAAAAIATPWAHLFARPGVEYKMHSLRKNVGYFTERGGTIGYYLAEDGVVVIDSQFPPSAKNLIAEIQKKTDQKIDLLINTHHHGDHSGGNIAFKGLVNQVVAHANSKANQMRVAKARNQEATQLYPTMTFDKTWSQKVGGETVSMYYYGAAHTDGDAVTHFENANVVHMGDLLFNRRFPFIDKSAGASITNWIKVLESTKKEFDKDTIYIFGHSGEGYGVQGTADDLSAMQNYLSSLLKFVQGKIKAGQKLEDFEDKVAEIPGAPEWKGRGVQRSLSAAWQELMEE